MTANFNSYCQPPRVSLTREAELGIQSARLSELISLASFHEGASSRACKSQAPCAAWDGDCQDREISRPKVWNDLCTFKSGTKLFTVCFNLITPFRCLMKYMVSVTLAAEGPFQPLQRSPLSPTLVPPLPTVTQETGGKVINSPPK